MKSIQLKNGNIYFMDLFWASSAKKWWKRREKKIDHDGDFSRICISLCNNFTICDFFIQFREDNKQKEIFICWRFIINDSLECARWFGSVWHMQNISWSKIKKCEWRKKTRKKYVLKPRIITSYDNADWENGMTKVGPLWLIWLRCRCYCFSFSWFYGFFRRYCCCFAAHKYVHHEHCHFMFLYFSFHLFFFWKSQKKYKYHQEHQEQENKNCYCHSSCRLFNLDDFFFGEKPSRYGR